MAILFPQMMHFKMSETSSIPLPTNSQDHSSNFPKNYKRWRKLILLVDFYLVDDSLSLTWHPLKASQFVQLSLD